MQYEKPNVEIIQSEAEDIVTLSNGGKGSGGGQNFLRSDWSWSSNE